MIDGKPNRMANRDYTFLSQIEEKRNEVFKIIFLGTEEKPTNLRKEILNNLIQLLNKPFKLTQIRLEYNFLYNVQDHILFFQCYQKNKITYVYI